MKNLFDIKDKVAVITGAGGTLGSSAAKALAAAGVKTILLGRNFENIKAVADAIQLSGGEAHPIKADVLDKAGLEIVKDEILKKYKSVDILLNIAGGNMPGATIGVGQTIFDIDLNDMNKVVDLNLNGTIIPSLVFGKTMAEQNKGVIINYSSMAVPQVITRVAGYSASKAAMENFTRWMAVEMASKFNGNIRVNAIAPGFFIGKQNKSLLTNPDGSYTDRGTTIIKNTPMNRFGEADELNGLLHFLCSDASKFITGTVIPVDGGFSAFSGV